MPVGHGLGSTVTTSPQHVIVPHPHDPARRIVFVDMPGFDDPYVDDVGILKLIVVWLARS